MKRLYFVRHGQSQANVDQVFAGQSDTPLTTLGRDQARYAGKQAKALRIDHILSSPLSRARETAEIIAREIGYPLSDIEVDDQLMERSYGSLQGQSWETKVDIDSVPDVETLEALMERARLTYEHLQQQPYDTILVVGHGTFYRALRAAIQQHGSFNEGDEPENAQIVRLL